MHHLEVLGRIIGRHCIIAPVAQPDLVNQDAGVERNLTLHAAEQHESAHGLAVGAGVYLAIFCRSLGFVLDDPTDRRGKAKAPDRAAEIKGAENGTAIGFQYHGGAADPGLRRIVANEGEELARGIRRYHARSRDELPAGARASIRRTFRQECKTHR